MKRCFQLLLAAVLTCPAPFALAGAGVAVAGPVGAVAGQSVAPPAAAPEASLVMERDARCRQFIATCLVNGRPARLMVDTGATHTVLAADFAARELPQLEKLEGVTLSGNAETAPIPAYATLQIGAFAPARALVLVMDLRGVNSLMAERIDGILGMAQLGQLPFVLDLRGDGKGYWAEVAERLPLHPLEGRSDEAGRLVLPARCGEKTCPLLLDSGSSTTSWPQGQWPAGEQDESGVRVADVNGARESGMRRGKLAPLELPGGLVLPQVSPLMQPGESGHVLGLDALSGCLLTHRPGQGFFLALPDAVPPAARHQDEEEPPMQKLPTL